MPINFEERPNYQGPLIRVPLGQGRFIKMTEQEAVARGFLARKSEEPKKREPASNKKRQPAPNKAADPNPGGA